MEEDGDGGSDRLVRDPRSQCKEANWLPVPKGDFVAMLRMYWLKETTPSIPPPGSGTWAPPLKLVGRRAAYVRFWHLADQSAPEYEVRRVSRP